MRLSDPHPPQGYAAAPYGFLAALHDSGPIHAIAGCDAWAVTGYALARRLLRDERLIPGRASSFRSRSPEFRAAVVAPLRKAMAPPLERDIEEAVSAATAEAFSDLPEGVECDLVPSVSQRIPTLVMMRLLGLPAADLRFLATLSGRAFKDYHLRWESREINAAVADGILHRYFRHILMTVAPETEAPLMRQLLRIHSDSGMEREGLANVCVRLLTAGTGTTAGGLANILVRLMHSPGAELPDPADEARFAAWIEEALRLDLPVLAVGRIATTDLRLDGATIRAGQRVTLWIGAANRDPAQFDAPDAIQLDRRDPRHLSFGPGGFHCIGAHLARCEVRELVRALLSGPRVLRPAGPAAWSEGWMVHEPRSVPAVLSSSYR